VNCTGKAGFHRTDVERYHDAAPKLNRSTAIKREEIFVISRRLTTSEVQLHRYDPPRFPPRPFIC